MNEYMEVNRERWNELVALHADSTSDYDLEGFKNGDIRIRTLEREEVGEVTGKSLLHLQCHFGIDTLSWARLGARVTGIDYSDQAITLARSLSQELHIPATFVLSNVYDLLQSLDAAEQFDIVYTSHGVIGWLPDLKPWAQVIAHYLKPGGFFYIAEAHPFMWTFDNDSPNFELKYPYFLREPIRTDAEGSYATAAKVQHSTEYGWNHTFSEILGSLLEVGLKVDFLHEYPFSAWKCFPNMDMQESADRWYTITDPDKADMIPLTFTLKATKV